MLCSYLATDLVPQDLKRAALSYKCRRFSVFPKIPCTSIRTTYGPTGVTPLLYFSLLPRFSEYAFELRQNFNRLFRGFQKVEFVPFSIDLMVVSRAIVQLLFRFFRQYFPLKYTAAQPVCRMFMICFLAVLSFQTDQSRERQSRRDGYCAGLG